MSALAFALLRSKNKTIHLSAGGNQSETSNNLFLSPQY